MTNLTIRISSKGEQMVAQTGHTYGDSEGKILFCAVHGTGGLILIDLSNGQIYSTTETVLARRYHRKVGTFSAAFDFGTPNETDSYYTDDTDRLYYKAIPGLVDLETGLIFRDDEVGDTFFKIENLVLNLD